MKTSLTQYAFTTGKVTSNVHGRTDVAPLASAVKEAINVTPLEQGPFIFRTGTEFVAETKYSDKKTRLVEFTFSTDEALILEVGHLYIRFFIGGAAVIKDGSIYEIETPFTEDIIHELGIAGTADIIDITHSSFNPVTISRYANDDWRISEVLFVDGPFESLNTDSSLVMWLSSTEEPLEIRCSKPIFNDTHVGRLFCLRKPATNLADGGAAFFRLGTVNEYYGAAPEVGKSINATPLETIPGVFSTVITESQGTIHWQFGLFGQQETYPQLDKKFTVSGASVSIINGDYTEAILSNGGRVWIKDGSVMGADTLTGVLSGAYIGSEYYLEGADPSLWGAYAVSDGISTLAYKHQDLYYRVYDDYPEYFVPQLNPYNSQYGWGVPDGPDGVVLPGAFAITPTQTIYLEEIRVGGTLVAKRTNWPSVVAFHQGRKVYASSVDYPEALWFSHIAYTDKFSPVNAQNEVTDDVGFSYRLYGGDLNRVVWLLSAGQLVIGTIGDEFVSATSNDSAPITPTDVAFIRQSARGSVNYQRALLVGGSVVYAQRLGNIIRGMDYDVATARFRSVDLTKLADSILLDDGGFKQASYSPEPSSVLYYLTQGGKIKTLTYEQDDKVIAWAEVELGGTNPVVQAVATIPSSIGSYYDTYYIIDRVINGVQKRYIERSTPKYEDRNYWCYLDSSLSFHTDDVTQAISTFAGLEHLEGETVGVIAGGVYRGDYVVENGQVSFGQEPEPLTDSEGEYLTDSSGELLYGTIKYQHVVIGLRYGAIIQLLPVEGNLQSGSTFGKMKRTLGMSLQVADTLGVKVGKSLDALDDLILDSDTEPNTGVYNILINEDWGSSAGDIYIKHDVPYPFTLLTATREVEFRD